MIVAGDAMASRALPTAGVGAASRGEVSLDATSVHRVALAIMADRAADVMPTAAILALPVGGNPTDGP